MLATSSPIVSGIIGIVGTTRMLSSAPLSTTGEEGGTVAAAFTFGCVVGDGRALGRSAEGGGRALGRSAFGSVVGGGRALGRGAFGCIVGGRRELG